MSHNTDQLEYKLVDVHIEFYIALIAMLHINCQELRIALFYIALIAILHVNCQDTSSQQKKTDEVIDDNV